MIQKSKKIADVFGDGSSNIEVHVFVPDVLVHGICAFIVIEDNVKNTYRQDIALITLNADGKFGSEKCPKRIFRQIESELGYVPDTFLYESEWHDVLSRRYLDDDDGTILRNIIEFINSVTGSTFGVTLSVDDIIKEVADYTEKVDSAIDDFDFCI